MTWGWCHRARGVPSETLIRGPATARHDNVFGAIDEQTVIVPGTNTLDVIVPSLAKSLAAVHKQRRALEAQIQALLEAHPPRS